MRYKLIHSNNSSRLILIFAGWSTDPDFYADIRHEGWDIAVVYDYSDLSLPSGILDSYDTVALFAWSLGVFAASVSIPFEKIALAIAINGTEYPVDDERGIPVNIYQGTADSLSERNLMKFRRRMCGSDYSEVAPKFTSSASISQLQLQLNTIAGALPSLPGKWDRVYISLHDNIFPPQSQAFAWRNHPESPDIVEIDTPHYVNLQTIIKSVLPAREKVGERFHKALGTYDSQAEAQRISASRLVQFAPAMRVGKVLEIGPGTGVFTRLFAARFHPESIDFVDLYPLPNYEVADNERYFIADAEEWVADNVRLAPECYDAIVSASALQWFINPDAFFRNAERLLKPGGVLLCSTFLPGNLNELRASGNPGLIYRTEQHIREMLARYFKSYHTEGLETVMSFPSPRHTLQHLRHTGVGGGMQSSRPLAQLLSSFPTSLTYRPLLLYAVKQPIGTEC